MSIAKRFFNRIQFRIYSNSGIRILLFDILFHLATFFVCLRISLVGLSPQVRHFSVAVEHVGCWHSCLFSYPHVITDFDTKRENVAKRSKDSLCVENYL